MWTKDSSIARGSTGTGGIGKHGDLIAFWVFSLLYLFTFFFWLIIKFAFGGKKNYYYTTQRKSVLPKMTVILSMRNSKKESKLGAKDSTEDKELAWSLAHTAGERAGCWGLSKVQASKHRLRTSEPDMTKDGVGTGNAGEQPL